MKPLATSSTGGPTLAALNQALSEIFRLPPLELTLGADDAFKDGLVVCGILGGKDVGKSTLINALVGEPVSHDSESIGRGTDRPTAYIHRSGANALAQRFEVHDAAAWHVSLHQAELIRNVALIDLPDFDSEFLDHLDAVRRLLPRLDRVLWVMSPRKIGDRAWVALAQNAWKDSSNISYVLNKVDELIADSDAWSDTEPAERDGGVQRGHRLWQQHIRWVDETLRSVGHEPREDRRFLIAAAYPEPERFAARIAEGWDDPGWTRYSIDRPCVEALAALARTDWQRLQAHVLSPVSKADALELKEANRSREWESVAVRLGSHYGLPSALAGLRRACDPEYHLEIVAEVFDDGFIHHAGTVFESQLRADTELAREVLDEQIHRWPLLPIVYYALGWLSRGIGRRIAGTGQGWAADRDPFEFGGISLQQRMGHLHSRLLADHAGMMHSLDLQKEILTPEELSDRLTRGAAGLVPECEQRMLDQLRGCHRPPSLAAKTLIWLILVWFIAAQPVLEEVLRAVADSSPWTWVRVASRLVGAFSALHLLAGLGIVAAAYVAITTGMYYRRVRSIRQARSGDRSSVEASEGAGNAQSVLAEAFRQCIISAVLSPLMLPFERRLERLSAIVRDLGGNTGLSHTEMDSVDRTAPRAASDGSAP